MRENLKAYDELMKYCPRLGHDVPFKYCRLPGSEQPCRTLVGCWRDAFDAEAFAAAHFSAGQIEHMRAPPPDRAATLVELIDRARRAAGKDE